MRGDGVGIGQLGAVHGGTELRWIATGSGDSRDAIRECDGCMVCGWSRYERGGGDQRCRGRRSIDDGAWGEHGGQGGVHVEGSGGADGMRGDGVGI